MTARQKRHIVLVLLATTMLASVTWAQNRDDAPDPGEERISALAAFGIGPTEGAPPRAEGEGPFSRLVIRGATLIDGTGAPPRGPVDIVVVNNRISEIRSVGNPVLCPAVGGSNDAFCVMAQGRQGRYPTAY